MHDKQHGPTGSMGSMGPMGPMGPGPSQEAPGVHGSHGQAAGGAYGPGMGNPQGAGLHGPGMHYGPGHGPFGPDMQQHWGGPQGPGFGYGPPPGAYGPMPPGWGPYAPGYGPQHPPGADPAAAGLSAAMNEIADQSGLGALKGFLNFNDGEFWKGALVGAAVVLLMTNEDLRGALLGGAAKTANAMKAGMAGLGEESAAEAGEPQSDQAAEEEQGQ